MPAPTAVADPPKEPPKPEVDPELAQLLRDFKGIVEEDTTKPSEALPASSPGSVTLGEAVKNAEEKRLIKEEADKDKPPEPEQKDETKPDPAKEEKPAPPPTPAAATPPKVEVKTKEAVQKELQDVIDKRIADTLSKTQATPQTSTPAGEQTKPPTTQEDEYEAKLGEIEQEELRFARYAATKDPNLKEYPKQLIDYLKKAEAYAEKARKDDPERTLDDEDQEWRKWQRDNRPKVSPVLRRKLEREQVVEEAEAKADQKWRAEIARVEKRQEMLEKRPLIEKITQEFSNGLDEILQAQAEGEQSPIAPIAKRAKEVGWNKAVEEDPMFAPIVQRVASTANTIANEFLGIVNGTISYDAANAHHRWISNFITKQGEDFKINGGEALMRSGQQFLPRQQYAEIATSNPERAAAYWTWSDGEILQRIAINAKQNALKAIQVEQERLTKAGFERKKPDPPKNDLPPKEKKPTEEPKQSGSPKAPSSSSPGIAQPSKVSGPVGAFAAEEIDSIIPGYKKP